MREMVLLADVKSGFHFLAMKTGYSQLKNAEMRKMAKKMEESAPNVWGLLSVLLSADPKRTYSREWAREKVTAANLKKARMPLAPPTSDVEMGHPASKNSELEGNGFKEDDYFRYFDDILFDEDEDEPEDIEEQREERYDAYLRIVSLLLQHRRMLYDKKD